MTIIDMIITISLYAKLLPQKHYFYQGNNVIYSGKIQCR